jgi:cell division protein ZapA (FtsZ GTPase activity inhibitor)
MATRRITVKIGGKEYPMTIKQKDEEKYRRAAKEINKLITAYKASYVAEPEDYLAMAAIQVAVGKVTLEMDRSLSNQLAELEALNREIDNYLNDVKL